MWLAIVSINNYVVVYHLIIMQQWYVDQHAFAIKSYYKNNDCIVHSQRQFRIHFTILRYGRVSFRAINLRIYKYAPISVHIPALLRARRHWIVSQIDGFSVLQSMLLRGMGKKSFCWQAKHYTSQKKSREEITRIPLTWYMVLCKFVMNI